LKEEYQKFIKNYEENLKNISESIEKLINEIKKSDEEKIFGIIKQLNSYPIRFSEFVELKELIFKNIETIPITKQNNLLEFINFFDKFDLENYEEHFIKIMNKYEEKFNYFSPDDLVTIIYNFSKFRIFEKKIWDNLLKIISKQISNLKTHSLSKLFLGLAMLKVSDTELFLLNSSEDKIFAEIVQEISRPNNSKVINSQDVFRICISLTKKPINIMEVPNELWKKMQEVFIVNLHDYDLYQISQILLLFCETPLISEKLFNAVESEIVTNYLEKIGDLKKLPNHQINIVSLLEDLCKISFSFALTIKGSLNFWNLFLNVCVVLKDSLSIPSIESLNFILYRNIDYFTKHFSYDNLNKNLLEDCYKNLDELSQIIEKKVIEEKLLERNELDPFNMMMPYARTGNNNYTIWNYITKNILNILENPQFQMNPFLLADLTYAFSSHTYSLNAENEGNLETTNNKSENFGNSFYMKNFVKIWDALESHIIKTTQYLDVTYVTNMIVDLSQINLELKKSWNLLADKVREYLSKNSYDLDNFILVLIGLKKRDYQDKNLWDEIEKYLEANIKKVNMEQLKRITVALVKAQDTNSQNIYSLIASRFCDNEIIEKYDFEQFVDLQIPFALIGIGNDKIWNKFEEILFKNFDSIKENKPLLLSTLYSFSRLNKGSGLVWNKFAQMISDKIDEMDIDDLGHLGICLRENIIKKYNLSKILNEQFWNKYLIIVDNNISNASIVTCNNLLLIFKDNDIVKANSKIIKKIQDKITLLSR